MKSIQTNLLNMSKKPTVHYSTWDTLRNEEMLKLTAYMKSTSQNQRISKSTKREFKKNMCKKRITSINSLLNT